MAASLDRKPVLYLDGIRYSLHIFDLAAERPAKALTELSSEQLEPKTLAEKIAHAMADAWLMIDSAHRLRELLQQAPKLKKNLPELQLFLRRTKKSRGPASLLPTLPHRDQRLCESGYATLGHIILGPCRRDWRMNRKYQPSRVAA